MGLSRRNVLIGLGGIVAGGGALVGTGAFTTVQAERSVNVQTTGDASAFIALQPTDQTNTTHDNGEYASISNGTLELDLSTTDQSSNTGLNLNAITTIRSIFQITNNGSNELSELRLRFSDWPSPQGNFPLQDTFEFTVDDVGGGNSEEYPHPDTSNTPVNGVDILQNNHSLGAGESLWVGLIIDLVDGGDDGTTPNGGNLPNGDYSLEITANTS